MEEKNVVIIKDLFAGFGFKKYEAYIKGESKFSIELRNVKNVEHIGD